MASTKTFVVLLWIFCGGSVAADSYAEDDEYSDDIVSNFRSCVSPNTLPRGIYLALSQPCEFRFYQAATEEPPSESRLSKSCAAGKLLLEKEDYALLWPDECVGSFLRCYSLSPPTDTSPMNLTEAFMMMNWTIPAEATHMSANCTADRQATEKAVHDITATFQEGVDAFVFFAKALFYLTLFGILACVYLCCIKPAFSSRRPEPQQVLAYEMVPSANVRVVSRSIRSPDMVKV